MKYFVVSLSEKNKKTLSSELLKDHITFLKDLDKKGLLVLCGPFEFKFIKLVARKKQRISLSKIPLFQKATI